MSLAEKTEEDRIYDRVFALFPRDMWNRNIIRTPGWQPGFQVYFDWAAELRGEPPAPCGRPLLDDTWIEKVHIISHMVWLEIWEAKHPGVPARFAPSHCKEHALLEESLARRVVAWWKTRPASFRP